MKKSHLIIMLLALAMLACSLATPFDPEKDVVMAASSNWMDLEILKQFPSAVIWPPVGVEKGAHLYRIFKYEGQDYMAIFEQGEQEWELVDVVKLRSPSTPEPSEYMKDT
jgi:hypothetical protein